MSPDEPTRLHFAYATSEPNLEAFDVKRVVPSSLLGEPAALTVIGESHYVGVPTLDFHEVCSCKPLSGDSTAEAVLEPGVEREFAFENDRLRVETSAAVRPIEAFPGPESADAAFRFAPDAWTTIDLAASANGETASYETYHTYPEHELALYTNTKLHPARHALDTRRASDTQHASAHQRARNARDPDERRTDQTDCLTETDRQTNRPRQTDLS